MVENVLLLQKDAQHKQQYYQRGGGGRGECLLLRPGRLRPHTPLVTSSRPELLDPCHGQAIKYLYVLTLIGLHEPYNLFHKSFLPTNVNNTIKLNNIEEGLIVRSIIKRTCSLGVQLGDLDNTFWEDDKGGNLLALLWSKTVHKRSRLLPAVPKKTLRWRAHGRARLLSLE